MKFVIKALALLFMIVVISTQNIENEIVKLNIYNNVTNFLSGKDVGIKLIQNMHQHNNTNKYVGSFEINSKNKDQRGDSPFIDEILNFGKKLDEDKFSFDLRYIMNCKFEIKDEPQETIVEFKAISKESTSQHIYNIEILFGQNINKEEISTYFKKIEKTCTDTQQVIEGFKNELDKLMNENYKLKNSKTKGNTTIAPEDVTDPLIKAEMSKLKYEIETIDKEIKTNIESKEKEAKRNAEILKKLNEEKNKLQLLNSKNDVNSKHTGSAGKTLEVLNKDVNDIIKENTVHEKSLGEFNKTVIDCEKRLEEKQDQVPKNRTQVAELNKQKDVLRKQITDNDSKNQALTDSLKGIADKAIDLNNRLNNIQGDKKDSSSNTNLVGIDIDALQAELKRLEDDKIKFNKTIEEVKKKMEPLQMKENNLYSRVNNEKLNKDKNPKTEKTANLEELEKNLLQKKKDLLNLVDPKISEIVTKATNMIIDPAIQDEMAWRKELENVPESIYKFKF
jgi:chromosome segregation ATPase